MVRLDDMVFGVGEKRVHVNNRTYFHGRGHELWNLKSWQVCAPARYDP